MVESVEQELSDAGEGQMVTSDGADEVEVTDVANAGDSDAVGNLGLGATLSTVVNSTTVEELYPMGTV